MFQDRDFFYFENICQVGVLLVNRSELLEMQRVKMGEEEGAEGFNLHTQRAGDRLRLQIGRAHV